MIEFCTLFDQRYLPRGLVLYESLRRHCPDFRLHVLCLDDATYRVLEAEQEPALVPIKLTELEAADPGIAAVRGEREPLDYYMTVKPSFIAFVLDHCPESNLVAFLDADQFVFSDPSVISEEMASGSVGLVPHHYSAHISAAAGRFNAGYLEFSHDARARELLERWRSQCIEWCEVRFEDGRFADQKYLDEWAGVEGVSVIESPGAQVGPWGLAGLQPRRNGAGQVMLDGGPLIFFHFSHLSRINRWVYNPGFEFFDQRPSPEVVSLIYAPYVEALEAAYRRLAPFQLQTRPLLPHVNLGFWRHVPFGQTIRPAVRSAVHVWRGTVGRGYLYLINGRVINGRHELKAV